MNKDCLWSVHKKSNIAFSHGKGCFLFKRSIFLKKAKYLDFNAGGGVISVGYSNKKLNFILNKQSKKLWHVSNYYQNPVAENFAKNLCSIADFEKAFFVNSGAEGVEFALKVARKFTYSKSEEKNEIISIKGGYHGRTMGALSTSSNPFHREGFGPLLEGFIFASPNIEEIESKITHKTSAIIIEPILSHKDMKFLGWNFLEELRFLCDRYDILLIFDEIQTGMGRTGKMFAFQYTSIKPDILILSKGISNGFPFGAVLSSKKIASCMIASSHGGTFGGNPLACAVANEVLKQISSEEFLNNVVKSSIYLEIALKDLQKKFPNIIKEVSGFGLMRGLVIKEVDHIPGLLKIAINQNRLLLVKTNDNTIRITPPLIIKEDEIKIGINKLKRIFGDFVKNFSS